MERVMCSIRNIRKYKDATRAIGEIVVFASEDVFDVMEASGLLTSDYRGYYRLDKYPVRCANGYPRGYISAELSCNSL